MKKIFPFFSSMAAPIKTSFASEDTSCCSAKGESTYLESVKLGDGSASTVVVAYAQIDPQERELFLELYAELAKNTQKEEGCLEYTLWRDFKGENTFFSYEEFVDDAALVAHMQSPHSKEFVKKAAVLKTFKRHAKVYNTTPSSEPQ